jgi:hypothetical protein
VAAEPSATRCGFAVGKDDAVEPAARFVPLPEFPGQPQPGRFVRGTFRLQGEMGNAAGRHGRRKHAGPAAELDDGDPVRAADRGAVRNLCRQVRVFSAPGLSKRRSRIGPRRKIAAQGTTMPGLAVEDLVAGWAPERRHQVLFAALAHDERAGSHGIHSHGLRSAKTLLLNKTAQCRALGVLGHVFFIGTRRHDGIVDVARPTFLDGQRGMCDKQGIRAKPPNMRAFEK